MNWLILLFGLIVGCAFGLLIVGIFFAARCAECRMEMEERLLEQSKRMKEE